MVSHTARVTSKGIQQFSSSPGAEAVLVCFPHAGGAASYYRPLSTALGTDMDVLAVQYPGRQNRRTEPLARTVDQLVDDSVEALEPWTNRPLSLFGHSMGAVVAYEVARRLTAAGSPPVTLVVSGRRAPGDEQRGEVHLRDDAGLLTEIRRLGGTDLRVLESPDMRALFLPVLRADYQAVETYRHTQGPQLSCPVLALAGESDPVASPAEMRHWAARTSAGFDVLAFSGGHFYLAENSAAVASAVRDHVIALTR
ncbi:thioesterase II family protein [Streptomyces minutiscleroticus]|uniref:thioesterase II family protein n=1 Tax=Streptomyces minutiscleroticus TaxID=68238 RepID=UPI00331752E2